MFDRLAHEHLDWDATRIYQVDERVVREDNDLRNLKNLRAALSSTERAPIVAMDVDGDDLEEACRDYAACCRVSSTSCNSASDPTDIARRSSRAIRS